MNKYYWCKTIKEHDWLMGKLEKERYLWRSGTKPTKESFFNFLNKHKHGVIIEANTKSKTIILNEARFFLREKGIEESDFILVSDLMNKEKESKVDGLGESMDIIIEVVKYNTDDVSEGIKLFNTLKYLFRYGKKNGVEDLEKARNYLDMLIEEVVE